MTLDFDAHTRSESARFGKVLAGADPATPVPGNPDWTAADLAWHLTEVHDFWARIIRDRLADPDPAEAAKPERPAAYADVLAVYERCTADLLAALAGADDATAIWTWAPEQTVGFVRRFQAHEALIHRVDAELVAGTVTSLPPELAADGADVVLRYSMTWRPGWASWSRTGVVGELSASDTGRRWRVALGAWGGLSPDTGKTYTDEPALELLDDGDAAAPTFAVTAPAADLDAWLWNRAGFGEVSVDGARADFDALAALVARGVQ